MRFVYLILAMFVLAGCQPNKPTMPVQPPISPEQQQCVERCLTLQDRCVKTYDRLYEQCVMQKKQQAEQAYQAYVKTQTQAQGKVEKQPAAFLDLASCQQQLDCAADYERCYNRCDI